MHRYALKINESNLTLITLLNGGVTPEIEKTPTFFVVTIEDGENSHPEIITEESFRQLQLETNEPVLYVYNLKK